MSLKPKKSQILPEPPSDKPGKWTGPWGRINPGAPSFDVVRFCKGPIHIAQKTHSYPYRVISSWHWIEGELEELKIEAGADLITVTGRGLDCIVEALDRGTLEILCEVPGDISQMEESPIWVTAITIAEKPND